MSLRGVITGELGDFDWVNETDNWTEEDATWLQERSVVRVAVTSGNPANKPTTGALPHTGSTPGAWGTVRSSVPEGRVFYDTTYHRLLVAIDGSETYSYPMMAKKLQAFDTGDGTTVELRNLDQSAGTGITLTPNNAKVKTLNLTQTGGNTAITLENDSRIVGNNTMLVGAGVDLTIYASTGDISIATTDVTKTVYLGKKVAYNTGSVIINNGWSYRGATRPSAADVPEGTIWTPT